VTDFDSLKSRMLTIKNRRRKALEVYSAELMACSRLEDEIRMECQHTSAKIIHRWESSYKTHFGDMELSHPYLVCEVCGRDLGKSNERTFR